MRIAVIGGDAIAEIVAKTSPTLLVVCREAFVDGPLSGEGDSFWRERERFVSENCGAPVEDYRLRVRDELLKLADVPDGAEIELWFGDDLFCQVNMWFVIGLIGESLARIYRVFPRSIDFGAETEREMLEAYRNRVEIGPEAQKLAADLWKAFADRDGGRLLELSNDPATGFRRLDEVGGAAAEIETRPAESLRRIVTETGDDPGVVFKEFSRREAIYGFGDTQVRSRLQSVLEF